MDELAKKSMKATRVIFINYQLATIYSLSFYEDLSIHDKTNLNVFIRSWGTLNGIE